MSNEQKPVIVSREAIENDPEFKFQLKKLRESQRREFRILAVLNEAPEDLSYFGFNYLSARTKLHRQQVRLDVRRMARKGWTKYSKGLWSEDGEPGGAGYAITNEGRAALAQSEENK